MLCGCVIFTFRLVPDLLRIKCGPKFARASFWCQFVTGLYPVKNSHLNEPSKQCWPLNIDERVSTVCVDISVHSDSRRTSQNTRCLVDIGTSSIISLSALAQARNTFLFHLLLQIHAYLHIWMHFSAYGPSICVSTATCTVHTPAFNSTYNSISSLWHWESLQGTLNAKATQKRHNRISKQVPPYLRFFCSTSANKTVSSKSRHLRDPVNRKKSTHMKD